MDNLVRTYGYLLNLDYQPKEGEIIWDIFIGEKFYKKGIEGINLKTCSDYVIIGNASEFTAYISALENQPIPIM